MKPNTIRLIRYWHARTGVFAALLLLLNAATGIALNHTNGLNLEHRQIRTPWLMHWYGFRNSAHVSIWQTNSNKISVVDQQLLINRQIVSAHYPQIVGVGEQAGLLYVATEQTLDVYLPNGRLVEHLDSIHLPALPIMHLGVIEQELVMKTAQGNYIADENLQWHPSTAPFEQWSNSRSATEQEINDAASIAGAHLSLERIILDLHSGRILGKYGPLLMDVAAIALILLSISGLWAYKNRTNKA